MKKIYYLIAFTMFAFSSCSTDDGSVGPQGPPGPPGQDGLIGSVFEVPGDFTAANNYGIFAEFNSIEVYESDVVLVYLRERQSGTADGEPVYIWRPLPQTYYVDGGTVQYNFEYTFFEVEIFLESNLDPGTLDQSFTNNQVFRVAVVPAAFAADHNVDVSDFNALMNAMKVQDDLVPLLEIRD